ncbi:MAG TPA: hypothetical protein DDX39_09580 [Bacteroidales bacterium]|nr:MAG: hypothetical protein A2W98_15485 [Bacteroidetes bacterium GWF2_33_38]HBF88879.1 hypothetical protein [Bacteroidales bacterium]
MFITSCGTSKKLADNNTVKPDSTKIQKHKIDTALINHNVIFIETDRPDTVHPNPDYMIIIVDPNLKNATLEKIDAPDKIQQILPGVEFYVKTIPASGNKLPIIDTKEMVAKYNEEEYKMTRDIKRLYINSGKNYGDEDCLKLIIYLRFWVGNFNEEKYKSKYEEKKSIDIDKDLIIKNIKTKVVKKENYTLSAVVTFLYNGDKYEAGFTKYEGEIFRMLIFNKGNLHSQWTL